jgi:hypothetical protein
MRHETFGGRMNSRTRIHKALLALSMLTTAVGGEAIRAADQPDGLIYACASKGFLYTSGQDETGRINLIEKSLANSSPTERLYTAPSPGFGSEQFAARWRVAHGRFWALGPMIEAPGKHRAEIPSFPLEYIRKLSKPERPTLVIGNPISSGPWQYGKTLREHWRFDQFRKKASETGEPKLVERGKWSPWHLAAHCEPLFDAFNRYVVLPENDSSLHFDIVPLKLGSCLIVLWGDRTIELWDCSFTTENGYPESKVDVEHETRWTLIAKHELGPAAPFFSFLREDQLYLLTNDGQVFQVSVKPNGETPDQPLRKADVPVRVVIEDLDCNRCFAFTNDYYFELTAPLSQQLFDFPKRNLKHPTEALRALVQCAQAVVPAEPQPEPEPPRPAPPVIEPDKFTQELFQELVRITANQKREADGTYSLDMVRILEIIHVLDKNPSKTAAQFAWFLAQAEEEQFYIVLGILGRYSNVVRTPEALEGVVPYLAAPTRQGRFARKLLGEIERPAIPDTPEFAHYRAFLSNNDESDAEPLIRYMYRRAPGQAMLTMASVKQTTPDRYRELQLAEHTVRDATWKLSKSFKAEFEQVAPQVRADLAKLASAEEWWVRMYVASIMRIPQLRDEKIFGALTTDPHPLVRGVQDPISERELRD